MLSGKDIYRIVATITPLHVAMILAYASVRFWKIFTPQQCAGISKYVATFAVPILSFHVIASCNFYDMNYRFLGADTLQKVVILASLLLWLFSSRNASLEWAISFFSLSTLPNTLIIGIPLLQAMYGDPSSSLMVQIVVLQVLIWYALLLILFEYRGAMILIKEHFPDCSRAITSIRVDPDVVSLKVPELLEADAEIDCDGMVHVAVQRSSASSMGSTLRKSLEDLNSIATTPRASNLSGVELQSLSRTSSLNKPDGQYGSEKHRISGGSTEADWIVEAETTGFGERSYRGRKQLGAQEETAQNGCSHLGAQEETSTFTGTQNFQERMNKHAENAPELSNKEGKAVNTEVGMPPLTVMTRLIVSMAGRKLIRNPNLYASILGLAWSLLSFKLHLHMPPIVSGSIQILSDTGLGMAMFSLGLFMGLQPTLVTCGYSTATFALALRFIVGPLVTAGTSAALGLRGHLLRISIVQAALPAAIVPFVFASQFNVHADIMSVTVIFGMLLTLPVGLLYFAVLAAI